MGKEKLIVFIDAESVSAGHCGGIIGQCRKCGEIAEARYYARQKDPATKAWLREADRRDIRKFLIGGPPAPNKIDGHIIKDAKKMAETQPDVGIFCIASRDGDYTELVHDLKRCGKKVYILAAKNTSRKLRSAADKVLRI